MPKTATGTASASATRSMRSAPARPVSGQVPAPPATQNAAQGNRPPAPAERPCRTATGSAVRPAQAPARPARTPRGAAGPEAHRPATPAPTRPKARPARPSRLSAARSSRRVPAPACRFHGQRPHRSSPVSRPSLWAHKAPPHVPHKAPTRPAARCPWPDRPASVRNPHWARPAGQPSAPRPPASPPTPPPPPAGSPVPLA
jgi:translation initiation factor IF-2